MNAPTAKVTYFLLFLSLFSLILSACGGASTRSEESNNDNVNTLAISGTPLTTVNRNNAYTFTPSISNPDGGTLTFTISNQPAWSTFDAASGELTGTPSNLNIGSTYNILISVSNGNSTASLPSFDLQVVNVNNPPTYVSGIPGNLIVVGNLYNYSPIVTDVDGDALSFTIINKPDWAQFNTSSGSLTGSPSASDIGTINGIIITASDGSLSTSLAAFNITVVNVFSNLSIYVDTQIGSNCNTYNHTTRSCQGGEAAAYSTLNSGLAAATSGTTLLLRGGSYGQLSPPQSGIEGQPITIMGYPGEPARISNLSSTVAIWIINRTDLIIDNLIVENVLGFARIQDSSRITIKNTTFDTSLSNGTTGALKIVRSSFNHILNNTINNGGGDSLLLQDSSNNNAIIGNSFYSAYHSIFSIRCSNNNVIRANTFSNPIQKIAEIFDCEGVSDAPVIYDATKHNLIENNKFILTRSTDRDHRYNAIQHGGQENIVRHNVFSNNLGGGVNYPQYASESMHVYGNRMYNNTFYSNHCSAIIGDIPDDATIYYDNIVSNNLLYKNAGCDGTGSQTNIRQSQYVILENNAITNVDPLFIDEANLDFRLNPASPHVDTGKFLTKVIGSGTGTSLKVSDASYFYDGFGILGEVGDTIQLENQNVSATITSIDYVNNMISIDRALTWIDGQAVSLQYNGTAPDIGAYETD